MTWPRDIFNMFWSTQASRWTENTAQLTRRCTMIFINWILAHPKYNFTRLLSSGLRIKKKNCTLARSHRLEVMEWAIRVLTADHHRPSMVMRGAQELHICMLCFCNPRPPKVDHGNGFVWWPTPKDFQHVWLSRKVWKYLLDPNFNNLEGYRASQPPITVPYTATTKIALEP